MSAVKTSLRKTREHLQSLQRKHTKLKQRVAAQDEALARYLGGVTDFGYYVLKELSVRTVNDILLVGGLMADAITRGLLTQDENGRFVLTHDVAHTGKEKES